MSTTPRFQLLFLSDERRGERVPIDRDGLSVGRSSDAEIHCKNPSVSRQHAVFRYMGDRLMVEDVGSSGGTRINSTRIESNRAVQVENGDEITFGHFHTQVLLLDDFDDAFDDGEKTMFAVDGDLPSDLAAILAQCQDAGNSTDPEVFSDQPASRDRAAYATPHANTIFTKASAMEDLGEAPHVPASQSLVILLTLLLLALVVLLIMAVFKWPIDFMSLF